MSKKEQLITFDTAKLAKDKGFKLGIGWHGFEDWFYDKDGNMTANYRGDNPCSPTQALLQKWLREEHDIVLIIDYLGNPKLGYYPVFKIIDNNQVMVSTAFENYEEALEGGLFGALTLILKQ